jgi:hypothetical protein
MSARLHKLSVSLAAWLTWWHLSAGVHCNGWQVLPFTGTVQHVVKPDVGGTPSVPAGSAADSRMQHCLTSTALVPLAVCRFCICDALHGYVEGTGSQWQRQPFCFAGTTKQHCFFCWPAAWT